MSDTWLLRAQQRLAAAVRRRPWVLDLLVMVPVILSGLRDVYGDERASAGGPFGDQQLGTLPPGVTAVLVAVMVVALWWRRRAPGVVLAIILAVTFGSWLAGAWLQAGMAMLLALYAVARYGNLRTLAWACAGTAVVVVTGLFALLSVSHPWHAGFFMLGTATAAVALALTVRTRAAYLAALEDRARRLEVERDQRERLTAATERSRVAREMHDIVGHNLSVMIGLADGGAVLAASRGESTAEPLRLIGETGRQALGELRRVLGVLRDGTTDARLSPQPGVADLDDLVRRVRAAGLDVDYRTDGDIGAFGDGLQLTVYRIVQEALTNTLKHAGAGSAATVTVSAAGDRTVRVRVRDTGPAPGFVAAAADEPGHGLTGIRERAGLYGGEVVAGRDDAGGWRIEALLHDRPAALA
ncbi:sensor histidine kinase [Catenuloplanes atrovinosus]|uniref:histidine kinase n=1 Tax=Catenuloplanes atrovinosus TaxID=137266 RepID=A0AAE3YMR4_9ACTN|nr:histidine kinase [Catenuloplanes atrovinosus]MDR7276350.1 signal transduction histidine kinase [Catenuloplanes atrovinosus]